MNTDIFGLAIQDYYTSNSPEDITVIAPDFDDDLIPIAYLFREYSLMPAIEQKALELSYGTVLDVGCGAGSHSLYLQKEKKLNVKAIDISAGAIRIAHKRGVSNAACENFFDQEGSYDTLLFLMNGSGIIGRLPNIDYFFTQVKKLLHPKGQILIDSSDISYLFEDEDGGFWVDANADYYGEMKYKLRYKGDESEWFDWLYIDYNTLVNAANAHGFICECIIKGENNDYLARITAKKNTL
ncbi:class I SAM-dependent methyltransferase [Aquimarina hainanensis]|uniref:Class I SAM-dependent methyltransferase n=1 Tax=Aquimarina hainanensis TaxID=1578017 RepID=A0ABW5N7L6_9FLAO|nr:class I SAM-dependent methyltransferase [Aquimarina sp. TRL1]QKX05625.1 class I SAM-dependent methyltransferase [Aquimarina sp. TRL1]